MVHISFDPKVYANVGADGSKTAYHKIWKEYFIIAHYSPDWKLRQAVDSLERNLDNQVTSFICVRDQNTITCSLKADFVIICQD